MTTPDEAFQKWQSKWMVGTLEVFMLYVIDYRQSYGGELVRLSKKLIDNDVKVPTVYGILSRLEDWKFIQKSSSSVEEGVTRGTSRKYYGLTEKGKEYFYLIKKQISDLMEVLQFDEQLLMEVLEE